VISIVVPARNEERYLPDCLQSLREQSYTGDSEIIIADNGSTDGTAAIAEDSGAKVVFFFNSVSAFDARAVGAGAARGGGT
jgi:glycosyltransferase involved in cell wall biosynthesis